MSESLTQLQWERILRKVRDGLYPSSEDAIEKALALLDEHDQELAETRAKVSAAREEIAAGEYRDYSDESLHVLFDRINERGRKLLASRGGDEDIAE